MFIKIISMETLALQDFVIANAQFSADLFKELLKTNDKNLLVCPLSLQIILTLVHAGAKGSTAQQLSDNLYFPESAKDIKTIFKHLETEKRYFLNKYFTITSANKVYINNGFDINEQFKTTAVQDFFAEIQNIDFGQNQKAAAEINKWVEKQTRYKIRNIVEPGDLDSDTAAMLINAMYFQGRWSDPFEECFTMKQPFYLSNGDKIEVDTMSEISYLDYCENLHLDAKFLVKRYAGHLPSMTIVLPNDRNGLDKLEKQICEVLDERKYQNVRVNFAIPKFKIESNIKLVPVLKALGIVDAFEDEADFSGIIKNLPLKISEVKQKTYIDVNEDGTTAAAATVVELMVGCCENPPKPKQFIVDHPFIFILKIEDIIIFIGKCVSPTY